MVLGRKNGVLGVFWTECEVADLKQRQRTTAMDHRNKIQSLVLLTDDPGDAPGCITEYGPCICEYGCMCHTAPTAQKYGFSIEQLGLYSAFLVQPEPSKSMPITTCGQQHKTHGKHASGPSKGSSGWPAGWLAGWLARNKIHKLRRRRSSRKELAQWAETHSPMRRSGV